MFARATNERVLFYSYPYNKIHFCFFYTVLSHDFEKIILLNVAVKYFFHVIILNVFDFSLPNNITRFLSPIDKIHIVETTLFKLMI